MRKILMGQSFFFYSAAITRRAPDHFPGESLMLDTRLAGPALLLLGSAAMLGFLAAPQGPFPEQAAYAGLALIVLGSAAALAGWRNETGRNFAGHRRPGHAGSARPAKRLKIRIRCAR